MDPRQPGGVAGTGRVRAAGRQAAAARALLRGVHSAGAGRDRGGVGERVFRGAVRPYARAHANGGLFVCVCLFTRLFVLCNNNMSIVTTDKSAGAVCLVLRK